VLVLPVGSAELLVDVCGCCEDESSGVLVVLMVDVLLEVVVGFIVVEE
jgi:hypothetical protein